MRVRDAWPQDAAAIAQIYRCYVEDSVASFEEVAPTAVQLAERMQAAPRLPWLLAEDDAGRIVGYAYAARHRERGAYRWAADCSVYLERDSTGRGIGRLLYSALLAVLREHGYWRAYAGIALPNPGSVRLHETMGFVPVGVYRQVGYKRGSWHDVGWWQLSLAGTSSASEPPDEPRQWHPAGGG